MNLLTFRNFLSLVSFIYFLDLARFRYLPLSSGGEVSIFVRKSYVTRVYKDIQELMQVNCESIFY